MRLVFTDGPMAGKAVVIDSKDFRKELQVGLDADGRLLVLGTFVAAKRGIRSAISTYRLEDDGWHWVDDSAWYRDVRPPASN
jgi:hypothetical protein